MRAIMFGAAFAAVAAPSAALAEQAPGLVVACAAPTLLECSILAPGFDRWFIAPLGIAPSDAEMAEEVCRRGKAFGVASTRRLPVRRGLLNNTKVVEVTCARQQAEPPARPHIVARSPARPEAGPAPVLAGSPQDFSPLPEGRRASRAEAEADWRAKRRARRLEARLEAREEAESRSRRSERPAERDRRSARTADDVREPATRPLPLVDRKPAPVRAEPTPAAADRRVEPRPETSAARPAVEERKPAGADRPARTTAEPPKARQDPSISYEHF